MIPPKQDEYDRELRRYIFDHFIRMGKAPLATEAAVALTSPLLEIKAAFRRLEEQHILVLQKESGEILMALPFSAVPTSFHVESRDRSWWGNCIWDALGIPTMLNVDARIVTSCGDCNEAMILTVKDGQVVEGFGVIHFAVPAKHWFDNVVFT